MAGNSEQFQGTRQVLSAGAQPMDVHTKAVVAIVVAFHHSGAEVRMPDGQKASLPWKEIWPEFKIHDTYSNYFVVEEMHRNLPMVRALEIGVDPLSANGRALKAGDKIVVISCGQAFGRGYRTSVSHVKAFNNPWDKVAEWKDKEVKSLTVELISANNAWGTIHPGIRARVSLDGIGSLLPEDVWRRHQMPLPGDEIAGWFLKDKVDETDQTVTLDYINYILSSVSIQDILGTAITASQHAENDSSEKDHLVSLQQDNPAHVKTLLLLDDDGDFRDSLCQYLREKHGMTILACATDVEAQDIIDTQGTEIDFAILDVNLGTTKNVQEDHRGVLVARYLREQYPKCPIVLTTGEEISSPGHHALGEPALTVQDIVYKPFGTDSLQRALSATGKPARSLLDLHTSSNTATNSAHSDVSMTSKIQETLVDLNESLSAEATCLFRICPISDEVHILAMAGPQHIYHTRNKNLSWSPIRDAAVNQEEIFSNDASCPPDFPKHRYLYYAYRYKSCVGVPINTGGTDSYAYSLFAFHPKDYRFAEQDALDRMRSAAREIGLNLKINKLEEQIRLMKPFELMGQAYGSMAHDLSKDLSISFMFEDIKSKLTAGEHKEALDLVTSAATRVGHAQHIVRSFRDMARGQHEEVSDFAASQAIIEILNRLEIELRDYPTALRVSINVDSVYSLRMRKSTLDQLLTNIVLNAAQQMERLPSTFPRKREVHVIVSVNIDDLGMPWLEIQISDNGPGIHQRDFSRVFELLYTTKESGCGMGLDICRKIARDVIYGKYHGVVKVSRSILLCGTVFEVRLPIRKQGTEV